MKENKYDDKKFFGLYAKMRRSIGGLDEAGEWHELKRMLPDFARKRVLDLGCGYGWHCRYAAEQGAASVTGIDISERMLAEAAARTDSPVIKYLRAPIEDITFPADSFDAVISSLAFHYVEPFVEVCRKVSRCLSDNGDFVFSVEHPVFTAQGPQDWFYGAEGSKLHWPVDRYFEEGRRKAVFLGEEVVKYHRTLTTYIDTLLKSGFEIKGLTEPQPDENLINEPGMRDELRRPMMLIISAKKAAGK